MNKAIIELIIFIVRQASPQIKELLINFILDVEDKAKATPNPIDDILIDILKIMLDMD